MPQDLSSTVNDLFATQQGCWRRALTGDADALMTAVETRAVETGERPSCTRLLEKLKAFGVQTSESAVRRHIHQQCGCDRG